LHDTTTEWMHRDARIPVEQDSGTSDHDARWMLMVAVKLRARRGCVSDRLIM
jgi:hypothetical protein